MAASLSRSLSSRDSQSIAQGPGPPQRPQIPGADDDLAADCCAAPTAKTLKLRAVFCEPHLGHSTFCPSLMLRASFSNFESQLLHVYS
jgi:hypothetical protein